MQNFPDERSLGKLTRRAAEAMSERITSLAEDAACFAESPIETLLGTALQAQILTGHWPHTHLYRIQPDLATNIGPSTVTSRPLFLQPQKLVGGVRVDFVVTTDVLPMYGSYDGENASLIVECDGHDFHERTKGQVIRDRSRDRTFQEQGFTVFRFTGSEIYNSAWECAYQIMNWAADRAWK